MLEIFVGVFVLYAAAAFLQFRQIPLENRIFIGIMRLLLGSVAVLGYMLNSIAHYVISGVPELTTVEVFSMMVVLDWMTLFSGMFFILCEYAIEMLYARAVVNEPKHGSGKDGLKLES